MNKIHPLACVSPKAKIGENVEIGPYAYIDDEVESSSAFKSKGFFNFCIKWLGPIFMALIVFGQIQSIIINRTV